MKNQMFRRVASAATIAVLFGFTAVAHAIPITGGTGTGGLGDFTGSLTYSSGSSTQGTLTLSLTNASPSANGGFITAFLLNNPDGLISSISSTNFSDNDFDLLALTDNGLNGAPNGQFDFGASTGGSYQGGGSPNVGIAVNDSATFTFGLTGTGLGMLTAQSFINELSDGSSGAGEGTEWLVVRFRGFDDGGSDKVPGRTDDGVPPVNVPEPTTLLLLGIGLLAMVRMGRFAR